ncbi:MAG: hypothetical protein ACR2P7_01035 [bacterium]
MRYFDDAMTARMRGDDHNAATPTTTLACFGGVINARGEPNAADRNYAANNCSGTTELAALV